VSVDPVNGLATALNPGLGGVIATLGEVRSPAVPFKSCLPVKIILHLNGDPAGMPTESVTLKVSDTKTVQVDMIDENNFTAAGAAPGTSTATNTVGVASGAATPGTAQSGGGAVLPGACTPPNWGGGLTPPLYTTLFTTPSTGSSGPTPVYPPPPSPPPTASP